MSSSTAPSRASTAPFVALGVLGAALLLAVAAAASPQTLAVALALCVVVLAWGWAGMLGLPTPRGTAVVVLVGGLALVGAVLLPGALLEWLPAALALAMIASFVHQLLRSDGRPRVVESVSSVVLAVAVVSGGVLLVPVSRTVEGIALLLAALAAAVASAGSDLLGAVPALRGWLTPLALLAGGAAACLVALLTAAPLGTWLLLGVASAAVSHAVRAVLVPLPTLAHPRPRLVTAVVSVLVVGLVPYLVAVAFVPQALGG